MTDTCLSPSALRVICCCPLLSTDAKGQINFEAAESGYDPQSGDLRLSYVPALRLQLEERERRLLPAAVQLKVHHLVVDGPQPPHRHLWVPAATLPQKPLCQQYRHRGREASMLIDSNENQKKKNLKNKNVWICVEERQTRTNSKQ